MTPLPSASPTPPPTPPQSKSAIGEGRKHRKVETLEKLLTVFTEEQLAQLAELLKMTQDMAILRECDQGVTISFNNKGMPRHFNASNNFRTVQPTSTYKAE